MPACATRRQTAPLKVALPGEAGAGGFGCKAARGLHDYVVKNGSADHPNAEVKFATGDCGQHHDRLH
ncbi:hypothetical protein [Escherichia coli]|uniref:hypothetical protein n=1 Tax=Escherichia coli TaxID=562 RepID=UPI002433A9C7|nr:hypothetical protein [Escherichia coli]MDG5877723.1 hypothetical protein [Escherichia coli]